MTMIFFNIHILAEIIKDAHFNMSKANITNIFEYSETFQNSYGNTCHPQIY